MVPCGAVRCMWCRNVHGDMYMCINVFFYDPDAGCWGVLVLVLVLVLRGSRSEPVSGAKRDELRGGWS